MNILQSIGAFFAPEERAVATFAKSVAADVVAWVKGEETIAIADAKAAWGQVMPIIAAITPSQSAILKDLVATAAKDAALGDYTAIAGAVIAQATTEETAFILKLGQDLVGVLVAMLAYKPSSGSPPQPVSKAA